MAVIIRELKSEDRQHIQRILLKTEVFRPNEIDVAMELVDAVLTSGRNDYRFLIAEDGGTPVGYVCWGATPGTSDTWDLYWIATDPDFQGKGTGRVLMNSAEKAMVDEGCRLCIVETSSLPSYNQTRRFYFGRGYKLEATVADYYNDGDDLCIFTKKLT